MKRQLTIAKLRAEMPHWDWRAEHYGFGWRYIGTRAFAEVTVSAYSVLSGMGEDDFETQWRVHQGDHSETYAHWWLVHHQP